MGHSPGDKENNNTYSSTHHITEEIFTKYTVIDIIHKKICYANKNIASRKLSNKTI